MSFAKYSLKDAKHQLSPFNLRDGGGQEEFSGRYCSLSAAVVY